MCTTLGVCLPCGQLSLMNVGTPDIGAQKMSAPQLPITSPVRAIDARIRVAEARLVVSKRKLKEVFKEVQLDRRELKELQERKNKFSNANITR